MLQIVLKHVSKSNKNLSTYRRNWLISRFQHRPFTSNAKITVVKELHHPKEPLLIPKSVVKSSESAISKLEKDLSQPILNHLKWMLQQDLLGQDIFLIERPGSMRVRLMTNFLDITHRELEYISLSHDTTESDLKQRREIKNGTAIYFDQSAVRAAIHGHCLIIHGIEKAEPRVLAALNGLLENREWHLEDGRSLIPSHKYDKLLQEFGADEIKRRGLIRVSERFRVIALGLPLPKYRDARLEPPFSKFQIRDITSTTHQSQDNREQMENLLTDENRDQIVIPASIEGQHKTLRNYAESLGLQSKLYGSGDDQILVVYKKGTTPVAPTIENATKFELSDDSYEQIATFLEQNPLNEADKQSIIYPPSDSQNRVNLPHLYGDLCSKIKVTVPPLVTSTQRVEAIRTSLPIYEHRDEILAAIKKHQVILISGGTGSGKTTQVPQYIMEECADLNRECRIICTQPRRLAATSIATRISDDRNDTLGKSVGYQIRLDSRITPTTNLVFTTSGYLLRCLTGSKQEEMYKSITHLIIDEVHEREKVTDFLLIAIRDAIKVNSHLKVILMSATLDSELFSGYFDNCPVINVPGRLFDVEIMHLGDVLMATGFKSKKMDIYMDENQEPKTLRTNQDAGRTVTKVYDDCFDECLNQDDDTPFEQIYCLITDENMPVDYMHSTKLRTALGIAAEKGFEEAITKLLALGADIKFMDGHGKTAFDYAKENEQNECYETLMHHQSFLPVKKQNNNEIDHKLLYHVISHIHNEKPTEGSILVFLPGLKDIVTQKDMIEKQFQANNYQLFVLHSGVNGTNSAEQTRVFDRMPQGIRKIILSTNIAETSLTINDVVYVVDAGKVKQLSYDSISESTCLTSTIISQACAKQRAGRAGRIQNGFCYRLYSKEQYDSMKMYTLPEIFRVPLTEVCLNAKMLAGDLSIEEFLLKALQPPSVKNIRQSIELLKKIGALDENENFTDLGVHLANMPVDCQYGKMILYSIVLRCLDPIVTIVSALSVKDPFMLPLGNEGEKINQIKKEFARDSMSDHQMLLNTYNEWANQKFKDEFCHEKFISSGNMQMIHDVRGLIMEHLKKAQLVSEDSARNFKKLNQNSMRWDVVKACLTAGMYPNLCRITNFGGQIFSKQDKKLLPHLSSILRQRRARGSIDPEVWKTDAEWLVHGEKSCIPNLSLKNISIVPAIDVILFTGPINLTDECISDENMNSNEVSLRIDDWIGFVLDQQEATHLYEFRQKFASLFSRFLRNSTTFQMTNEEEHFLKILIDVIKAEDQIEQYIKTKAKHREDNKLADNNDQAIGNSGAPQKIAIKCD